MSKKSKVVKRFPRSAERIIDGAFEAAYKAHEADRRQRIRSYSVINKDQGRPVDKVAEVAAKRMLTTIMTPDGRVL